MGFGDLFKEGDFKKEKHTPLIEVNDSLNKDEAANVKVSVGKEIAHPNTSEHHISWIEIYFLSEGEKFPYQLGRFEFSAHGASVQGPNTSGVYTAPSVSLVFKTEKSGVIYAASYCNIHGLWQSNKKMEIK